MCNLSEGIEKRGFDRGKEQEKIDSALRMLQSGALSLEQVANFAGLPIEKIQELAAGKSA